MFPVGVVVHEKGGKRQVIQAPPFIVGQPGVFGHPMIGGFGRPMMMMAPGGMIVGVPRVHRTPRCDDTSCQHHGERHGGVCTLYPMCDNTACSFRGERHKGKCMAVAFTFGTRRAGGAGGAGGARVAKFCDQCGFEFEHTHGKFCGGCGRRR